MGFGPWMEIATVSGRFKFLPSWVKDLLVSPRPWSSSRTLTGEPDGGGTMSIVREEGKSEVSGSRGEVGVDVDIISELFVVPPQSL